MSKLLPADIARKKREETKRVRQAGRADGQFELGTRVVDDPYEPGAKITVPANVRHDPLVRMRDRGEIDDGQYLAGEKLRSLREQAGERGAPAVDPSKEPVDGQPPYREPALAVHEACKQLARCQEVLGWRSYRLVCAVVCDGLNGTLIAHATGNRIDRKQVGQRVRDALEDLGVHFGFLTDERHRNQRASMVAVLQEIAAWGHEEAEIRIEYAERRLTRSRKRA
jgi:hypothetical protein